MNIHIIELIFSHTLTQLQIAYNIASRLEGLVGLI